MSLDSVDVYLIDDGQKEVHAERKKQLQGVGSVYEVYSDQYPCTSREYDIYCLGLIFLSMIYRCPFSIKVALWMKRESMKCQGYPRILHHLRLHRGVVVTAYLDRLCNITHTLENVPH